MAGIGFVLRRLLKKNTFLSISHAYLHAVLASSGQWLFVVAALGFFFLLTKNLNTIHEFILFRLIILYNFAFSLVISSPVTMITTRYLADMIFRKEIKEAVGMMMGALTILFGISLALASFFYLFVFHLPVGTALIAIANFLILAGIWQASIFISALKYYTAITLTFFVGTFVSLFFAVLFANYSVAGMLLGFTIGLAIILSSLIALIFAEYPAKTTSFFGFASYFSKYWELALGGFIYNLGIWIDKWIMWFAPPALVLESGMRMFPFYDSAMFIAYLIVIPVLAMFVLTQETGFFEVYSHYYREILDHANYNQIEINKGKLLGSLLSGGKNLFLVQAGICILVLMSAPTLFEILGLKMVMLSMFRFGILGASFQILTLFLLIYLSYFDARKHVLTLQCLFTASNLVLSYFTMKLGFPYYGIGYMGACFITFIAAVAVTVKYTLRINYHTFITRNPATKEDPACKPQ